MEMTPQGATLFIGAVEYVDGSGPGTPEETTRSAGPKLEAWRRG